MDRTLEFTQLVQQISPDRIYDRTRCSPSPFLLKASDMLRQLKAFEELVISSFDSFVGFHRHLPQYTGQSNLVMTDGERLALSGEILRFMGAMATEIRSLSNNVDNMDNNAQTHFYKQVSSYLYQELNSFTKLSEKMQKTRESLPVNPYKLVSSDNNRKYISPISATPAEQSLDPLLRLTAQNNPLSFVGRATSKLTGKYTRKEDSSNHDTENKENSLLSSSFAQRYIDEIAPPSKVREYENIAAKHKASLLKEAKMLHVQFSDDMKESMRMEAVVTNISHMMTEFASMIDEQSDGVEYVGETSKDATKSVQITDEQLLLTLERTQSHQLSMVFLIVGLGVLLLILDFITP